MNKIILTIILAGFGAQLVKIIIYWFRNKALTWHDLIVTGGMPSSHSAFVIALTTIIYLEESINSAFAISLVLAMIVIRDAFGVRRSVGLEGKAIEKLFKINKIKSKFHYSLGHTPLQVFVGSVIGFIIAVLVHLLF